MVAYFAEVDPGDTSRIWTHDANSKRYVEGTRGIVTNARALQPSQISADPMPHFDLYNLVTVGGECLPYYEVESALSFAGDIGDPAATVTKTLTCVRSDIGELYEQKEAELLDHRNLIWFAACEAGHPAQALVVSEFARGAWAAVDKYFNDRNADRLDDVIAAILDNDTVADIQTAVAAIKPRWPPNTAVNFAVRSKAFGTDKLTEVTDVVEYGALAKSDGVFVVAIQMAAYACQLDIDAAYDANGGRTEDERWDDLAAVDVTSYAWPEFWEKA